MGNTIAQIQGMHAPGSNPEVRNFDACIQHNRELDTVGRSDSMVCVLKVRILTLVKSLYNKCM